jgi:hypothetical protein
MTKTLALFALWSIPFLVVMPWLLATSYAAYRDVRGVEVTADTEMLG